MNNVIYIITVMEKDGSKRNEYGFPDYGKIRSWGFYFKKDHALEALHKNIFDIWETCYDYAVLEEMKEGIAVDCGKESRTFFKYDPKKNGYFECEEHENLAEICNFALG